MTREDGFMDLELFKRYRLGSDEHQRYPADG
jgi:hypothetical protein